MLEQVSYDTAYIQYAQYITVKNIIAAYRQI